MRQAKVASQFRAEYGCASVIVLFAACSSACLPPRFKLLLSPFHSDARRVSNGKRHASPDRDPPGESHLSTIATNKARSQVRTSCQRSRRADSRASSALRAETLQATPHKQPTRFATRLPPRAPPDAGPAPPARTTPAPTRPSPVAPAAAALLRSLAVGRKRR